MLVAAPLLAIPPWPRQAPLRFALVDMVPSVQAMPVVAGVVGVVARASVLDFVFFECFVEEVEAVFDAGVIAVAAPVLLAPVQLATPPWPRQAPLLVFAEVVVPSLQVPVAAVWAWARVAPNRLARSRRVAPATGVRERKRIVTPRLGVLDLDRRTRLGRCRAGSHGCSLRSPNSLPGFTLCVRDAMRPPSR